ncbi:MAG TPA: preprotein translocase subunit YajC [Acidimicrobiales bacterium]|nr:preprotein translocase subunit YajC [Acidimicrobiales bacterium]
MHSVVNVISAVLAASSSSSKATTSASSSVGTLVFIVLLGVLAYVFFLRPRSQQARRQRENLQEVSTGDEILTGAGIFGRVLDVEADRVTIETAPGTRITVLRSTIARRLTEPEPEESEHWTDEDDSAATEDEALAHPEVDDEADPEPDEHEHHDGAEDPEAHGEEHNEVDEHDGGTAASGEPGKR